MESLEQEKLNNNVSHIHYADSPEEAIEHPKSHLLQSQIKVIEVVIEEMKTNRYCKLHSFTGSERDSDICNECHKTREGQISSLNETLEELKKSL